MSQRSKVSFEERCLHLEVTPQVDARGEVLYLCEACGAELTLPEAYGAVAKQRQPVKEETVSKMYRVPYEGVIRGELLVEADRPEEALETAMDRVIAGEFGDVDWVCLLDDAVQEVPEASGARERSL